jgi:hypothetical protein
VTGVRLLGDLGIVGIALFLAVAGKWYKVLRARGDVGGAVFMVSGMVVAMSCSTMALSVYLFLVGATLALAQVEGIQSPVNESDQSKQLALAPELGRTV